MPEGWTIHPGGDSASQDTPCKGNLVQNTKRDLERYREELLRLRERAVNVRIVKRNPLDINIRVDYPKGFEG